MANDIKVLKLITGEEVITTSNSHIKNYEHGAASFLSRIRFIDLKSVDSEKNLLSFISD